VGLDQWGNAVFESYEAGRAAKLQLLERMHGDKNVDAMLLSYSKADYTGSTHHRAQADFIYREGDRQGVNLRSKAIGDMNSAELAALADGIKGFEGWKVGTTSIVRTNLDRPPLVETDLPGGSGISLDNEHRIVPPKTSSRTLDPHIRRGAKGGDVQVLQESLNSLGYLGIGERPLKIDGDFGHNTTHAIKCFQRAHHLHVDGIVGKQTLAALEDAKRWPLLSEATHPQHRLYAQVEQGIDALPNAHGNAKELNNAAVALTIAAHASGLRQVDHVVLGANGINLFAVQGRMDDPGHRRVHVELAHAMTHALDHRVMSTPAAGHAHAMDIAQQQMAQRGPMMMGP
jgi:hypothetical protein